MNEQNHEPSSTSIPMLLPAKRKRGRPRKDGNLPKKDEGSLMPNSVNEGIRTVQHIESKPNDGSMIGRMVSGVIDGYFDAGYLLSVRIGNSGPFRGVIFEPGRFTPVTSSNNIAPQAKMFQRRKVQISVPGQQNQMNDVGSQSVLKQPVQSCMQQPMALHQVSTSVPQPSQSLVMRNQSHQSMLPIGNMSNCNISNPNLAEKMMMQQAPRPTYGSQFQSSPPVENLRMVEQDDAMQVYEVSVQSDGLQVDTEPAKDMISESFEQRTNNILHQKEIANQVNQSQNQDMGSRLEPSAQFRNDFNFLASENHLALETQVRQSEVKQNQDPYYEFHQHIVVAEPQSLPQKLTVIRSGFQPKELIQNKLQGISFELHETPVVAQTQYVPLENQHVKPENEIREHEHEMNRTSANTPHSISMEPANVGDQLDPSKLVQNVLGSKNHGIKEAFVPSNNSHFLLRELPPQSMEFVTEKPSSPKKDIQDAVHLQPESRTSENNQSIHSEKPLHSSSINGELVSLTAENAREAMPIDLEIAAEEATTSPGRPENQVSGFSSCTTELNLVPGNAVLRTETENNPGGLPESQQK